MKNIILILLIFNHISFGLPNIKASNYLPFLNVKSTNVGFQTIKKDTIFLEKVVEINGGESADQSSVGNQSASSNFSLIGQTFQAGVDGKMTAIKINYTPNVPSGTTVFKVYKGTSASGTLLSTNTFNPMAGFHEYRLPNLTPLQKDQVYFMEFSPGFQLFHTVNNYLRGETDKPVLANYDIFFETIVQRDFGVRINGNSGKIVSTGGFEGDGSLLTNLKLVGDGSQITNLNVQTIAQEAIQTPNLQNNWVNHEASFTNAGFWKDKQGLVHLQGLIKSGTTAISTVLFTLPAGYRPPTRQIFTVLSNNAISRIDIMTNGEVIIANTASNLWLNLSGIYFRVN